MEGQYRTDSLVLAFEQALQMKSALTQEEKVVLAIEALEREVNNGGFHQFFLNSSNEFASIVVSSLTEIGCPKTATLAQAAIDALGVEALSAATVEEAAVRGGEELASKLEPLDSIYFQGTEEPIADRLFLYIKANRAKVRASAV